MHTVSPGIHSVSMENKSEIWFSKQNDHSTPHQLQFTIQIILDEFSFVIWVNTSLLAINVHENPSLVSVTCHAQMNINTKYFTQWIIIYHVNNYHDLP